MALKILVLGGTQFVGLHIVGELMASGHAVTIFNRGQTVDELPPDVERLRGDRDCGIEGLAALTNRAWHVCIDVSGYTARQVRASAQKLRHYVGHYVYVSAVSVYGDPTSGPVLETYPRVLPASEDVIELNSETYGRLKVTCEDIVQEVYANRCTILRPQVVAGPFDPHDRFSYWVRRASQGGEMLAPGDGTDFLQVIDARDVARFTRLVCEQSIIGCFNLAGPRLQWSEFLSLLGAKHLVWVPATIFKAAGVTEFELPLFRPTGGPRSSLMHVSNQRAVAHGLKLTDPQRTVDVIRDWLPTSPLTAALSPERETQLIRISREAQ